jgi:hypothetical protein
VVGTLVGLAAVGGLAAPAFASGTGYVCGYWTIGAGNTVVICSTDATQGQPAADWTIDGTPHGPSGSVNTGGDWGIDPSLTVLVSPSVATVPSSVTITYDGLTDTVAVTGTSTSTPPAYTPPSTTTTTASSTTTTTAGGGGTTTTTSGTSTVSLISTAAGSWRDTLLAVAAGGLLVGAALLALRRGWRLLEGLSR